MILYNVTVKVDHTIADEWFNYIKETIAVEMLQTEYFTSYKISKLLFVPEDDGLTYSIQFLSPSMKHIHQYQIEFAPTIQQKHTQKFGEKALVYRTMMEIIAEG